jgi:hypothetical protein
MTEGSNPLGDTGVLNERNGAGAERPDSDAASGRHGRADDVRAAAATATEKTAEAAGRAAEAVKEKVVQNPHVAAATEKTAEAAGRAAEAVKEKVAQNPHVAAAAEKTRGAADRAAGAARDQIENHPRVASAVERAAGTSGKAARTAGQQARRHPRLAGGVAAVGAAFLAGRRSLRRRRGAKARSADASR